MLKRFGYTNLMMLGIGMYALYAYVNFQQPKFFDVFIMFSVGLTVLIHIARIIMFVVIDRMKKEYSS